MHSTYQANNTRETKEEGLTWLTLNNHQKWSTDKEKRFSASEVSCLRASESLTCHLAKSNFIKLMCVCV